MLYIILNVSYSLLKEKCYGMYLVGNVSKVDI